MKRWLLKTLNGQYLAVEFNGRTGRTTMWLEPGSSMSPTFDTEAQAQSYVDRFVTEHDVRPVLEELPTLTRRKK